VTVEEALLALVGLVALVLLFLGLVQALEGDPRARLRAARRRYGALPPRLPEPGESRPARTHVARRPVAALASAPPTATEPIATRARAERPAPERTASARTPAVPAVRVEAASDTAPEDPAARDWRDGVATLIRRRDWGEARQLIDPALAQGSMSVGTASFLVEVCSTAIARDLWRLRRARRPGPTDEAPLIASVENTRVLLDSRPAAALPGEQRRRAARRMWRGYTRLGLRRWRSGSFDAAVDALFPALAIADVGDRRHRLAGDLLVGTLEDMAGQSLELIPQLLGEGERAAALEQTQRLLVHIRRAREQGIQAEDLAVAASRARQLLEHIEQGSMR